MRILCLSYAYAPSVGGIESMSRTLTDEWKAMGHEVVIVTHTPSSEPDEPSILRRPSFSKLWELYRWSDVCYMNNISLKYLMPFLLSRRTVITAAGLPNDVGEKPSLASRVKRFFYAKRRTIAISHYMSRELKGATTIIPNCYDDKTFKNFIPWGQRQNEVVVVARLYSGKGVAIPIRALAELNKSGVTVNLTVIGSGPDEGDLAELVQTLGLEAQVTFAGSMRGEALAAAINQHKLFIVPSIYREPFGIVCLEGLACGCLVIASDTGGIPDAVGEAGVLFPMGDAEALAREIQVYVAAPQNPFAAKSIDHLAKCTSTAVASAYIRVFEEQIGAAKR